MNSAPSFKEFFRDINGYDPFPWQAKMQERMAAGNWPRSIVAPTGLGKTNVLDAFVYSLATDAADPAKRTVPTRAFYLINRRVVVDAAFTQAQKLAEKCASGTGPAGEIGKRLDRLGHDLTHPLAVVRMRGGVSWNWRWLEQPDQPAIVVGTIDQFGSRFLFRGYGVGARLRPIDAGLVGADCAVFLDEAHLDDAMRETIEWGHRFDGVDNTEIGPPSAVLPARRRLVTMSATSRPGIAANETASVTQADIDHAVAGPRLAASKRAVLVDAGGKEADLPDFMAAAARTIVKHSSGQPVVLVVANTVKNARSVHTLLLGDADFDCELVIGRCRGYEKEMASRKWWHRAEAGRVRSDAERALIVVATQTVEVGADLDVDALVTEASPFDSLVQRFGRVDRLGRVGSTTSIIVRSKPNHAKGKDAVETPVYGAKVEACWQWLVEQAGEPVAVKTADKFGKVDLLTARAFDFSPALVMALTDDLTEISSEPAPVPVLLRTQLDRWAWTSDAPTVEQSIVPYLHGFSRGRAVVQVCWRADVDGGFASLTELAPSGAELLEVPLGDVWRFLCGEGSESEDVEWAPEPSEQLRESQQPTRVGWVLRDGSWERLATRPRPGDVVVLSSFGGGHDAWGWNAASAQAVPDLGDTDSYVRLDRDVLKSHGIATSDVAAEVVGAISHWHHTDSGGEVLQDVGETVRSIVEKLPESSPSFVRDRLLRVADISSWALSDSPGQPWLMLGDESAVFRSRNKKLFGPGEGDDGNESSSRGERAVPLDQHLEAVGQRVAAVAENLGLSAEVQRSLVLAARGHDLGKADVRFQSILRGSHELVTDTDDLASMLAKSGRQQTDKQFGWPRGMRHEAVSLALLEGLPEAAFAGTDRELVLHLAATHHGWGRPLFPPVLDDGSVNVSVQFDGNTLKAASATATMDWNQPERLNRLSRKYGHWGLALLEATLRLADIAVSSEGS
jgi:CRISPR-associated endonuclease/helicase Cas3